ncbi:hypothetical protein AK830_g5692 [Neonectria ditissima]|uniref:Uncharacterized protein n=1 Tax=Neonectria ditissima TaxID=78410 RepID=A0A0P7B464_9HYPO|nr:hypothetical protein AK830_g5692 [Neonectria ditissima]
MIRSLNNTNKNNTKNNTCADPETRRNPAMAYYQPVHTSQDYEQGYPIYLITTPLQNQKRFLKNKPIDVFGHWAICIQDHYYELTRNPQKPLPKNEPKYKVRQMSKGDWEYFKKEEKRVIQPAAEPVGSEQVWQRSLQGKYVYDENNCQVFIRLLVDLIGNNETRARFPASFDIWVKRAGMTRDSTALAATAGMITVAAGVSLLAAPVDGGATAAAGFGLAATTALRSTTALFTDRHSKGEFIRKAQEELREKLRRDGILIY